MFSAIKIVVKVSDVRILAYTAAGFSRHRYDVIHALWFEKWNVYPVRLSGFCLLWEQRECSNCKLIHKF